MCRLNFIYYVQTMTEFCNKIRLNQINFIVLILLYSILLFNLIIHDGSDTSLLKFFLILSIPYLFFYKKIKIHPIYLITIIPSFVFISLNEILTQDSLYLIYSFLGNIEPLKHKLIEKYQTQFIYLLFLLSIPVLIKNLKFDTKTFLNILIFPLVTSIGLNLYLNFKFEFSRHLLYQELNPIILYDYSNIALSLIILTYSFYSQKKISYILILLSLFNIALIILHGTRGAWLGLPIAFILLYIYFHKDNFYKLLYIAITFLMLFISILLIPNSSIYERLLAFLSDIHHAQSNRLDTSTGVRLELWKLALNRFTDSPINGVGFNNFFNDICDAYKRGEIAECQLHAHNTFLEALVAHGILGFFAIICLFFAPLFFFINEKRKYSSNKTINFLTSLGIIFISYLIACSLTDYYFWMPLHTIFYVVIVFTIISLILKERKIL